MALKARLWPYAPQVGYKILNYAFKAYRFTAGGEPVELAAEDEAYFRNKRNGDSPILPPAFAVWDDAVEPEPDIPQAIANEVAKGGAITTADLKPQSFSQAQVQKMIADAIAQFAAMQAKAAGVAPVAAPVAAPVETAPAVAIPPDLTETQVENAAKLEAKFGPSDPPKGKRGR